MELTDAILSIDIWAIVKWFFVAGFGLYVIFSLIVWRQIHLMSKTLRGTMQMPIKTMGLMLVVTAIAVMVLSMMVL